MAREKLNWLQKAAHKDWEAETARAKRGTKERAHARFTEYLRLRCETLGVTVPANAKAYYTLPYGAALASCYFTYPVQSVERRRHVGWGGKATWHYEIVDGEEEISGTRMDLPTYCLPCADAMAYWLDYADRRECGETCWRLSA